jgi:hypothetical protein
MFFMDSRERDLRRTLGMRDKQTLYENAKGRLRQVQQAAGW